MAATAACIPRLPEGLRLGELAAAVGGWEAGPAGPAGVMGEPCGCACCECCWYCWYCWCCAARGMPCGTCWYCWYCCCCCWLGGPMGQIARKPGRACCVSCIGAWAAWGGWRITACCCACIRGECWPGACATPLPAAPSAAAAQQRGATDQVFVVVHRAFTYVASRGTPLLSPPDDVGKQGRASPAWNGAAVAAASAAPPLDCSSATS